ncbi:hypothetical protein [Streptomyces sp. LN785]|uniref:hypothetical protein n=1 Tax=Streptomyces sp. LN785 TaxID=3112983 RepID=UPI00372288D5
MSTTVTATSGTPVDEMSEDDLRVAILRILGDPTISDNLRPGRGGRRRYAGGCGTSWRPWG